MGWQTIYYLDDFWAILKKSSEININRNKHFFYYVYILLGLTINNKKNICGTVTDFRNIELDTNQIKACFPWDKLSKAKKWVAYVFDKRSITSQNL